MLSQFLFLIVLFALVVAFDQNPTKVKTDEIEGIICTNYADWKSITGAKEFWMPSKQEVLKAEQRIQEHLKTNTERYADLWKKLPAYKRQYVGIIVNDRKRIFCNFFCFPDGPPSEKPMIVFDGGTCFFHIEYDVSDKNCYEFKANASAAH